MNVGRGELNVAEYYNNKSSNYDDAFDTLLFRVYDAITWRYLEPYVPTSPNSLVLDAGGGTGRWAIRMAEKGCKVVLHDISDGMLRVASEKIAGKGLEQRIDVKKGDIKELSFDEETFDMVLCEHALFVFEDQDQAVDQLARVLKKKAPIVISAQNRYAQSLAHLPENLVPEKLVQASNVLLGLEYDSMTPDGAIKIHSLTPNEFRTMLEGHGFIVEKIIAKIVTTPLRISPQFIMTREYSADLFEKLLKLELAFCEQQDSLALAAHLQAMAHKIG